MLEQEADAALDDPAFSQGGGDMLASAGAAQFFHFWF